MKEVMVVRDDPKTGMELDLKVKVKGFDEFIEVFLECLKCNDEEGIDKVLDKWEDK